MIRRCLCVVACAFFVAEVFSSDMAVLIENNTDQDISINSSNLQSPSTVSDVWYRSSDLNSCVILHQSRKMLFITVDDSNTDKGYIRLQFPNHNDFFDLSFVGIPGWAGMVFTPLLRVGTKKAEQTPIISGSYKGIQSTNPRDKVVVVSITDN